MIVTEEFVYIHLPKTGGTFVEHVLARVFERTGTWYLDSSRRADRLLLGTSDQHESVREIPPEHATKPVVASIRNPYDWYVSLYEFAWWRVDPESEFDGDAVRARFPAYPQLDFAEFLTAVNDWRLLPRSWRRYARLMETAGVGWLSFLTASRLAWNPAPALRSLLKHGAEGLAADRDHPTITLLRTDTLNGDLHAFLAGLGFSGEHVDFVLGLERIYPREGGRDPRSRWEDYYDEQLKEHVRSKDRLLFQLVPEFDV